MKRPLSVLTPMEILRECDADGREDKYEKELASIP